MNTAQNSLKTLFNPKSIAVIGASRKEKKVGSVAVRNIIDSGFNGTIYPVNPKANKIDGLKAFPNVNSIPEIVDLAVIAIPAAGVNQVLTEIGEKGIKNVVVFTAGFKEGSEDGRALENELIKISEKYELNLLGPNCFGYVNNENPLNTTFGEVTKNKGKLKFISQSGALAASAFDWAKKYGLGFSEFVTLGNKAVINENDILEYWLDQDSINSDTPIGLYLESISDGKRFIELITQITTKAPVFILKPGRNASSHKAMVSHTGAIAGSDDVFAAALKQAGVIRCEGIEDMFDLARTLSWSPPIKGPNIAIISNAGGPGVVASDFISDFGMNLANLSKKTTDLISEQLPREASFMNPIDVLGDAQSDRYKLVLKQVIQEKDLDGIVVILTPQMMTEIEKTAEIIGKLSKSHKIPIFCSFIGGTSVDKGEQVLTEYRIPWFRYPKRAIFLMSKIWEWQYWLSNESKISSLVEVKPKISKLEIKKKIGILSFTEGIEILEHISVDYPKHMVTNSLGDSIKFLKKLKAPVVLKINAKNVFHKTEKGFVRKDIRTKEELKKEFTALEKLMPKGENIIIQEQIENGIEIILGLKKDQSFGYFILFGAGGIYAELIEDTNIRILPLSSKDVVSLVYDSKVYQLLSGYRGREKMNLESLYSTIQKIINVAQDENFSDFEINPLIITKDKTYAVDVKGIL